jgi:hypothetical protein
MRQRLVQVLESDDRDETESDPVVRRFWTRAKPLPARSGFERPTGAQVVDLAQWARKQRQ